MFREQEKTVQTIRVSLKEAVSLLDEAAVFLRTFRDKAGNSFLEYGDIEGRGISISEVIREAQRTTKALLNTRSARIAHLSNAKLNELQAASTAVTSTTRDFDQARRTLLDENKPFRIRQSGRIVTLISNEQIQDFGALADAISNSLESIRAGASNLVLSANDSDSDDEQALEAATLTQRIASELRSAQDGAQRSTSAAEDAEEKLAEVERLRAETEAAAQAITADGKGHSEAALKAVADLTAQVEAAGQRETEISEKSDAIAVLLEESQADRDSLSKFAAELKDTNDQLDAIMAKAESDAESRTRFIKEIQELVDRAEGMVSGATVAGLAKAFADERKDLEVGMKNAMKWFIVGIISLFLVTILLAAYVFELPINIFGLDLSGQGRTSQLGDEITIAGVISRTIILLAPFWLTLFSARRYRNLFDLRQQYSHKYNLAFSIDGFRKQAPNYGEELAAWVFHEISQPPVTSTSSRKLGDNPIPSLEALVNAAVARTNLFKDKGGEA